MDDHRRVAGFTALIACLVTVAVFFGRLGLAARDQKGAPSWNLELTGGFIALALAIGLIVWLIFWHPKPKLLSSTLEEQVLSLVKDNARSFADLERLTGAGRKFLQATITDLESEGRVEVVKGEIKQTLPALTQQVTDYSSPEVFRLGVHQGPRQVEFVTESNSPQRFYDTVDVPRAIRLVKPIMGDLVELSDLPCELELPEGKLLLKKVSDTGLLVEELLPAGVTIRFEVYPQ